MATISKSSSYLLQRNSIYYFRVGIPLALRDRLGRRELRVSLETGYLKAARLKAQLLATVSTAFFTQAQGDHDMARLNEKQLCGLFFKWLRKALDQWKHDHAVGKRKSVEEDIPKLKEQYELERIELGRSLQTGYYTGYKPEVIAIGNEYGRDIKSDEDEIKHFCHAYVNARKSYLGILLKRLDGDYDFEVDELNRFKQREILAYGDDEDVADSPSGVTTDPAKKHKLSEVIAKFIEEKSRSGAWGERSIKELPADCSLLAEVLGDMFIQDVGSAHMREFKDVLSKLPAGRRSNAFKGMSIKEMLAVEGVKGLSVKRQNDLLAQASSIFRYAEDHGYIEKTPAKRLHIKSKVRADEQKEIFSTEDLKAIFGSSVYTGEFPEKAWQFWLPLLGYFTGARIEELSQLDVSDIRKEGKVLVFDINESDEKRVKTMASRRLVPVHDALIKQYGFLKYLARVEKQGQTKLFPDLPRLGVRYGQRPSAWFSKFKSDLGIAGKKSFHSFRHTFVNTLKQLGVDETATGALTGHAHAKITYGRYGKPLTPEVLKKAVMKIPLPSVPGGGRSASGRRV